MSRRLCGEWAVGYVVVAHVIIVSAQSKELGFWVFLTWSDLRVRIWGLLGQGIGDLDSGLTIPHILARVAKNLHKFAYFMPQNECPPGSSKFPIVQRRLPGIVDTWQLSPGLGCLMIVSMTTVCWRNSRNGAGFTMFPLPHWVIRLMVVWSETIRMFVKIYECGILWALLALLCHQPDSPSQ